MNRIACHEPKNITHSIAADGKSITFYPCRVTSYHPMDVQNRYCMVCHRFMDLVEIAKLTEDVSQ